MLAARQLFHGLPGYQLPVVFQRRQFIRLVGQRQADPRQTKRFPRAGVEHLQQRPDQILAHRQHVPVAVGFGNKRVRHRRRRENEKRGLHRVTVIVELEFNLPGIQKVHLKILVVTMRLHVAAKKGRHACERLVVHIVGAQTFVVLLADINVGDRALAHDRSSVDPAASSECASAPARRPPVARPRTTARS